MAARNASSIAICRTAKLIFPPSISRT
jgi:hypothetical protein